MKKSILTTLLCILVGVTSMSQVTKSEFPNEYENEVLLKEVIHFQNEYIAFSNLYRKLFRSGDGGKTWQDYTPSGFSNTVTAISAYKDSIYIATLGGDIFMNTSLDTDWEKLPVITEMENIQTLLAYGIILYIGRRSDPYERRIGIITYNLATGKIVKGSQSITAAAGVNSLIMAGGKFVAGTNNGFYYEFLPLRLDDYLINYSSGNHTVHPGERWIFPGIRTNSPAYIYDKYMAPNEFRNLRVNHISWVPHLGMELFAATDDGLYSSTNDGEAWAKKYTYNRDLGMQFDFVSMEEIAKSGKRNEFIKNLLARESSDKIVATRNYVIIHNGVDFTVFCQKSRTNQFEDWKFFVPPHGNAGDYANITVLDDKKALVETHTGIYLIEDLERYLQGIK